MLTSAPAAIDGSKFKANNHRDKNYTPKKLAIREQRLQQAEARNNKRLAQIASGELVCSDARVAWFKQRQQKLLDEQKRLAEIAPRLAQAPDGQLSLTDPDARVMNCRGIGVVGYNCQIAVDAANHFIIYHDVINTASDRHQLFKMSLIAKAFLKAKIQVVVVDRGYYTSEQIYDCEQHGIRIYIPRPHTSVNESRGLYTREAFRYDAESDTYSCPANEQLIFRFESVESGKVMRTYWSSACASCPRKAQCTTGTQRRIKRWVHEELLEQVQERLDNEPDKMAQRRCTAEHPFGTLKLWMGYIHFQVRGLKRVKTEFSLHVLAYNLRRALNLLGSSALVEMFKSNNALKIIVISTMPTARQRDSQVTWPSHIGKLGHISLGSSYGGITSTA